MKQWIQPELLVLGVAHTTDSDMWKYKKLGLGDDKFVGSEHPAEWAFETS